MQENRSTTGTARNFFGFGVQLWLAGTLIALALLWITIITELDRDHELLIKQGEVEAISLANNYAKQIDFLFTQIDQLTFFLASATDSSNPAKSLQKLFDAMPKDSQMNPLFADDMGIIRSARTKLAINKDISNEDLFTGHRDSESLKIKIQKPATGVGYLAGKTVIRFSRRILKKDGRFGGIISIAFIRDELTNFIPSGSLQKNDVVGIKFSNGDWLSFQLINQHEQKNPQLRPLNTGHKLDLESTILVNNKISTFSTVSLRHYPLLAFVSIAHESIMAPYQETEQAYKLTLLTGTALLILTCIVGIWFQVRRDQQKRYAEGIQNTFRLAVDGAQ